MILLGTTSVLREFALPQLAFLNQGLGRDRASLASNPGDRDNGRSREAVPRRNAQDFRVRV